MSHRRGKHSRSQHLSMRRRNRAMYRRLLKYLPISSMGKRQCRAMAKGGGYGGGGLVIIPTRRTALKHKPVFYKQAVSRAGQPLVHFDELTEKTVPTWVIVTKRPNVKPTVSHKTPCPKHLSREEIQANMRRHFAKFYSAECGETAGMLDWEIQARLWKREERQTLQHFLRECRRSRLAEVSLADKPVPAGTSTRKRVRHK